MHPSLKPLIDIQELDIKMIRLMRVKKQRQKELMQIESLRTELGEQLSLKEEEIEKLNQQIAVLEEKIEALTEKYKTLESQQSNIKKVDEFNALTQEMTAVEREKSNLETEASNIFDKKVEKEDLLEKIKESLKASEDNSIELEKEIKASIDNINSEGQILKNQREALVPLCESEVLKTYERLIRNKKDRVIVPIQNRTCSGCHIALTLQHENQVRKGDAIIFCEHCSRIHFWQENESLDETVVTKRRRRRIVKT